MSEIMTDEQLAELAELHGAATQGEWRYTRPQFSKDYEISSDQSLFWVAKVLAFASSAVDGEDPQYAANAAFIVAAHNALPALLNRLREAEREREEALQQVQVLVKRCEVMKSMEGLSLDEIAARQIARDARQRKIGAAAELEQLRAYIQDHIAPDDARDDIRRACLNRLEDLRKEAEDARPR